MNPKELFYRLVKLRSVKHTTLNPKGPGNVRMHLVPPKFSLKAEDSVVILNGQDITLKGYWLTRSTVTVKTGLSAGSVA